MAPTSPTTSTSAAAKATTIRKGKPKPGVKYERIGVLDGKTGKVVQVSMEAKKAQALRARRAAGKTGGGAKPGGVKGGPSAETLALIPKPFQGVVDAGAIEKAVAAQIGSLNAPLEAGKATAQTAFDSNVAANDSITAQTQASLDTLLANAGARASGYQQLNDQASMLRAQNNAQALSGSALGGSLNPHMQDMIAGNLAAPIAQQNAAGVQATWADRLAQGAQSDFFQRGKGIAAIEQSAFTAGQRNRLSGILSNIAQSQAANQGRKAEFTRQMAQEDYTLATAFAGEQAKAAEAAEALRLKQYEAQTGRLSVSQRDVANQRTTAASRANAQTAAAARIKAEAAKATSKLGTEQRKAMGDAKKAIDTLIQSARKPISVTRPVLDSQGNPVIKNGKPVTTTTTTTRPMRDVFGANGGPWREAFTRLTDPMVGLDNNTAAMIAFRWYGQQSIAGKPRANIIKLLDNRGVTGSTRSTILAAAAGHNNKPGEIDRLNQSARPGGSRPSAARPAAVPSRNSPDAHKPPAGVSIPLPYQGGAKPPLAPNGKRIPANYGWVKVTGRWVYRKVG